MLFFFHYSFKNDIIFEYQIKQKTIYNFKLTNMLKRNSISNKTNNQNQRKSGTIVPRKKDQFALYQVAPSDPNIIIPQQQSNCKINNIFNLNHRNVKADPNFWIQFKQMKHIKILNLQNNNISTVYLYYLNQTIEQINLNHNSIQQLCLNKVFPYLRKLRVTNNNLLKISFSCNNPCLKFIDISNNKVSILNTIQLNNLQQLTASNNELVVINLNSNIKKINFAHNILKSLLFINKLKYLQYLNVSHNQISEVKHNNLNDKYSLTELYINNNKIKYLDDLQGCKNLTVLHIQYNQLFSFKKLLFYLQKLQSLQQLSFNHNQFAKQQISNYPTIQKYIWNKFVNLRILNSKQKNIQKTKVETQNSFKKHQTKQIKKFKQNISFSQQEDSILQKTSSKNYNYKQSPYKLYTDQLDDMQTKSKGQNSKYLNFTLGQKEQSSQLTLKNQSIFSPIEQQTNQQPNEQIMLGYRNIYNNIEQISSIPVRGILKKQRNKLIMKCVGDYQFNMINQLFYKQGKQLKYLIKCTHLDKLLRIDQINKNKELNKKFNLFLIESNISEQNFKKLLDKKINFYDFILWLEQGVYFGLQSNKYCQFNIMIKTQWQNLKNINDKIPLQKLKNITPVYLFQLKKSHLK